MSEHEMSIRVEHFEKRRSEKVDIVKKERDEICRYLAGINDDVTHPESELAKTKTYGIQIEEPKVAFASVTISSPQKKPQSAPSGDLASSSLSLAARRFQALKRRQQKDIKRIISNESKLAEMQKRLAKADADDALRKKEFTDRVNEQKMLKAEKKRAMEEEKRNREEAELARGRTSLRRRGSLRFGKLRWNDGRKRRELRKRRRGNLRGLELSNNNKPRLE